MQDSGYKLSSKYITHSGMNDRIDVSEPILDPVIEMNPTEEGNNETTTTRDKILTRHKSESNIMLGYMQN